MPLLTPEDLAPFADIDPAKAAAMIADATAMAELVAPCLEAADFPHPEAAKAILRGAVLRWNEAGSGAYTSQQASLGSASQTESFDNRQTRKGMFWPTEISQLQDLCRTADTGGAFDIDTIPKQGLAAHPPFCSLYFGSDTCSCGVAIAGHPIYERWP